MLSSAEGTFPDGSLAEQLRLFWGDWTGPEKDPRIHNGLTWTLSRCRVGEAVGENRGTVAGRANSGTVIK